MLGLSRRFFLIVILALPAPAAIAGPVKHVVIISIDGGKPAVMRESRMPNLMKMVAEGAHTWNAQTVLPSITLVSHTSMLTGVSPAKHKVLWNDWIPSKGLVKVPTVFALAKRSGYSTAAFAGKAKFRHLDVPETLDRFQIPGYNAAKVAKAAAEYLETRQPNLPGTII